MHWPSLHAWCQQKVEEYTRVWKSQVSEEMNKQNSAPNDQCKLDMWCTELELPVNRDKGIRDASDVSQLQCLNPLVAQALIRSCCPGLTSWLYIDVDILSAALHLLAIEYIGINLTQQMSCRSKSGFLMLPRKVAMMWRTLQWGAILQNQLQVKLDGTQTCALKQLGNRNLDLANKVKTGLTLQYSYLIELAMYNYMHRKWPLFDSVSIDCIVWYIHSC